MRPRKKLERIQFPSKLNALQAMAARSSRESFSTQACARERPQRKLACIIFDRGKIRCELFFAIV